VFSRQLTNQKSKQLLSSLAHGTHTETIDIVQTEDSDRGQAYTILKSLFDMAKKIYSQHASFLSSDDLNIREAKHRETIRTTNLATFVASVFSGEVGFYELHDHFIETFTPDGEPLNKEPGELYLSLKTQMFFSALLSEDADRTKDELLEDLFPEGIEDLLDERSLETHLSKTELDFVEKCRARREYLSNTITDMESTRRSISAKYEFG
jgi:hypothetical protein